MHINILNKNRDRALYFENKMVLRYPVSIGFDEQLLNPGVYLIRRYKRDNPTPDILIGGFDEDVELQKVQSDLQGFLQNVGLKIKYLKSVSEFNCTDLANVYHSNPYTAFKSTGGKGLYTSHYR